MIWSNDGLWTVAVCICCNVACALLGCLLVLRRLGMLGDAISHSVLPGIVLAYLLAGRVNPPLTLALAAVAGVLTAWIAERLKSVGRVAEDASLGIVFTTLFALGVVLINRYASDVDLDPGCVLFGSLELVPFDRVNIHLPGLGLVGSIPRAMGMLAYGLAITFIVLTLFWKEFKLAAFDPQLAASAGFSPWLLHLLLMALTATVVVAAFEAVGSVLVVTMLVAPPAAASLLVRNYLGYFVTATVIGIASAIFGHMAAVSLNVNEAGMMSVTAAGLFVLALLFSPTHGLVAHWLRQARFALIVARQDVLARMFRAEDGQKVIKPERTFWDQMIIRSLAFTGDATFDQTRWRLTDSGRNQARVLVRAHRLWEAYLERHFALPVDHLHEPAHRLEHFLDPNFLQKLEAELDQPSRDPHGREIPKATPQENGKN